MKMGRPLAVALHAGLGVLLLGAAAMTSPPEPASSAQPDLRSRLAGSWVEGCRPEDPLEVCCGTDTGMRLEPSGRYVLMGDAGAWRVDGDVVTLSWIGGGETEDGLPPPTDGQPQTARLSVVDLSADAMTTRAGDAEPLTWRRCPIVWPLAPAPPPS